MHEMNLRVNEDTKAELERVLKGLDFIPSIKAQIRSELTERIVDKKVDEILEVKSFDKMNLDNEEAVALFKTIYNFTRDDRFNTVNLLEEKKVKKGEKDGDPSLYYNYEFKMKYVERNYKENTQRVVKALFRKTAKLEKANEKDLYDFNVKEMREVLKSLNATTIRSLQNHVSTIEQYVDYALARKVTESRFNYATEFDSKKKLEPLLHEDAENMIFDREEIMDLALHADNAQDGVILGLLYDGVSHKNEFEELINLTEEDIDFENQEINLQDRVVPVSTETMILIKDALKQDDVYVSINPEQDKIRNYKIANGNHVLRGLRGKDKVKPQIISQRILRIANAYDYPFLNATTISYSGQLDYAKSLLNKYDLENVIDKVLRRFGVNVNSSSQFYLKNRIEKFLKL